MPINKSTTIFWFYYRIATMSDCLTIIYLSSDTDVLLASESQTPKLNCGLYEMYLYEKVLYPTKNIKCERSICLL